MPKKILAQPALRARGFPDTLVDALLAASMPARRLQRPWLIGLSALQGSGKSTLVAQLVNSAQARGVDALALSIDDFYLGRRERQRLARRLHPLFATRGVPGTHDVTLLEHTLDALARASARKPARIPRFDKGRDTRLPPSRWRVRSRAPALVLLEGWCVGVQAQDPGTLLRPLNALERTEDRDGHWRGHVNAALADDYERLWRRLDRLIVLQAPSFAVVRRWRDEQEQALRLRNAPQAMDAPALMRFIAHYERLSRHALRTLPQRADLVVNLDRERNVTRVSAVR